MTDFPANLKVSALFKEIADGIKDDPSVVKTIKAIIQYVITDGSKEVAKFTLDFKSDQPSVYLGDVKGGAAAQVTVTVSDSDFHDIATGVTNPQKAFMSGKLKAKGNLVLLQKMQKVLEAKKKAKL